MKAVRFTRHGKPEVLTTEDLPDPVPGDGEAVVRVVASSINPSDVKNVAGLMEQTTLPRTPGRDFAGVVVALQPSHSAVVVDKVVARLQLRFKQQPLVETLVEHLDLAAAEQQERLVYLQLQDHKVLVVTLHLQVPVVEAVDLDKVLLSQV